MKLYNCRRNSVVIVSKSESPPPNGLSVVDGERIKFHHIDGAYSYCHNMQGEVVHLPAWTEVVQVPEDGILD